MKILAIEKELDKIDWKSETDTLVAEAHQVYKLQQTGFIREIYFDNNHNAIVILECETMEKAAELLNSLPLVKKGLIKFDIIPLNPYTGFERIIKK